MLCIRLYPYQWMLTDKMQFPGSSRPGVLWEETTVRCSRGKAQLRLPSADCCLQCLDTKATATWLGRDLPSSRGQALGSQLKSVQLLRGHLPREADWQGQECWFNSTQPGAQALHQQSSRTTLSDLSPLLRTSIPANTNKAGAAFSTLPLVCTTAHSLRKK